MNELCAWRLLLQRIGRVDGEGNERWDWGLGGLAGVLRIGTKESVGFGVRY